MCGIAGIVGARRDGEITEAVIHRMCETIVHRGPDEEGIFVKDGAGLGMRRLSIIDLSGGHQPVFNEDRTCWIVFNGEIYNFPELRPQLEARGHRFYTNSDTEMIVHLYEDKGADCVQDLRGMFGFALYDSRKRSLLLARDRLGKKPLYYALADGKLYFASEIKAILAAAPELAEVNYEGLLQYLYFGYVPDPISAFTRIQKLPPGHLLEFHNGVINVRQYWDLPQYSTHQPKSEDECLEELEHRLAEAVRIRLISDVPLGALLSGGTDSSTVVALMARASAAPVKTFSIGFKQEDFNESTYAEIVARKFGTEHENLILEPDVVETVEELTRSLEEPFGDSSMLPTYYVSKLARQHVTVALSGDGGDELFAGYDRYRIHSQRQIFEKVPGWARRVYREQVYPRMPRSLHGRKFTYNVSLPWKERYVDGLSFVPAYERELPLLSPEFREHVAALSDPQDVLRGYFDRAPAPDPVSQMLYVDTKTYMVADILTKVDRMSMLTSLEVRVPLLDHKFVEWVTGLPPEWKLRGPKQKYILRKLAERVGVPREVLYRKKQGFSLPLVHWLRNELKDLVLSVLLEPRTLQRGYFDARGVRQILEEHFSGRRIHSGRIWRLLIFELWHRNFLERYTQSVPWRKAPYAVHGPVGSASSYALGQVAP
jgi:asparagine synthase (glutamine-hydrolysing)